MKSRGLGDVYKRQGEETTKETYDGWYKTVYMPTETTVTPSRASVGGK